MVRQYHYTGWPDVGSPDSGTGLIDLIGQVQRWQQQSGNTTITVHCRCVHNRYQLNLTTIPRARIEYEMVDSKQGA